MSNRGPIKIPLTQWAHVWVIVSFRKRGVIGPPLEGDWVLL